jgi:hypothetical protein
MKYILPLASLLAVAAYAFSVHATVVSLALIVGTLS